MAFKPTSTHKAANALQVSGADQVFVLETLQRLHISFGRFLREKCEGLTPQERAYYQVVSLLTKLVPAAIAAPRLGKPPAIFASIVSGVASGLDILHDLTFYVPADGGKHNVLLMLASPHGLSYLRDAAVAVRFAALYVTAINDREKERDRSGQSNLSKEVMARINELDAAADGELKAGKDRVSLLKKELAAPDFERELLSWAFRGEAVGQQLRAELDDGVKEWTRAVAESWKQNIRGWEQVKWAC